MLKSRELSYRRMLIIAATLGLAIAVTIGGAAYADTKWQTGVKVSHSFHGGWPGSETVGNKASSCGYVAYAEVQTDGDYVYVRDECKDGLSAVAKVRIYTKDGSAYDDRICRNSEGVNTWVKCNFNWIESSSDMCTWDDGVKCGNKALIVGVYDGDGGGDPYWDHGTSIWFSD